MSGVTTADGINVSTDTTSTDVTINTVAGDIYGADKGIDVSHDGSGYVSITTADVRGNDDEAIDVSTEDTSTDVIVNTVAGAVYGGDKGIEIDHEGSGVLSVTTADIDGGVRQSYRY